MRRFRKIIDVSIPLLGAVIVFLAVLLISDLNLQARLVTVLVGVLMIEAGVWKLTDPFLPSERKFTDLRAEVDGFIHKVRALNEAALDSGTSDDGESGQSVQSVLESMHASVDHMGELAGRAASEGP